MPVQSEETRMARRTDNALVSRWPDHARYRPLLQGILLLGGLASLGFGLWRGEAAAVLQKAVKVCLECIGIG